MLQNGIMYKAFVNYFGKMFIKDTEENCIKLLNNFVHLQYLHDLRVMRQYSNMK
jgi:hypothetical protein